MRMRGLLFQLQQLAALRVPQLALLPQIVALVLALDLALDLFLQRLPQPTWGVVLVAQSAQDQLGLHHHEGLHHLEVHHLLLNLHHVQ
jgi:hypothetical protein